MLEQTLEVLGSQNPLAALQQRCTGAWCAMGESLACRTWFCNVYSNAQCNRRPSIFLKAQGKWHQGTLCRHLPTWRDNSPECQFLLYGDSCVSLLPRLGFIHFCLHLRLSCMKRQRYFLNFYHVPSKALHICTGHLYARKLKKLLGFLSPSAITWERLMYTQQISLLYLM